MHSPSFTTVQHDPSASLIAAEIGCERGERVLFESLNFNLKAGQCLHVTGANGSGKTSLLKIIAGINHADSGDIRWGSHDHRDADFYSQSAYIGHKDGLKNELTAAENLTAYHLLERGAADQDQIDDHLARMGILQCADLSADKLSFGQRRRLAFARLLDADFSLWILDEPFTGIDQAGRELIEQLCLQHLKNNGMIILTNHRSLADTPLAVHITELAL